MSTKHIPVLLEETIKGLDIKPGDTVIDCTLGNAGHSMEIVKKIGQEGKLIGIDLDEVSLKRAKETLKGHEDQVEFVQDNFKNIKQILKQTNEQRGNSTINSILCDLGLAFYHYKEEGARGGFSFNQRARLDMRLDESNSITAVKIVNGYREGELVKIFSEYGEEIKSKTIAREIVKQRKIEKIEYTDQLADLIKEVHKNSRLKIHPATKVFQALRIAVNNEFENLKMFLEDSLEVLSPGGRLVVISYHSGEDRIVKEFFKKESTECLCPPQFPICNCGHQKQLKILTKKPIIASRDEISVNPSSRSAKLRIIEKIKTK